MNGLTRRSAAVTLSVLLLTSGCAAGKKEEGFEPRLDTDAKIQLDMIGFFGNFEALDQVMNDFNNIYPNVTYSYQQIGGSKEEAYLDANPDVDIFMTSSEFLHKKDGTLAGRCMDLSEAGIDFSAVDERMLGNSCIQGHQLAVPMGQNIYGLIVNTSLLEQEGLSVPGNRAEFLDTLSALKEKGYVPVQGPSDKIYAELTANMVFSGLCDGQPLQKALKDGNRQAAEAELMPALELVDELISNGYTDPDINAGYPEDNYDQAILHFLEGDVPFWVCNTEKVSGIKKRESKSEAFQKAPFSYEFIDAPIGEDTPYCYREPWFGFAANKSGAHPEYAAEFIRFLSTREELEKMGNIKGIPSVVKDGTVPEIYKNVLDSEVTKHGCVNQGEVTPDMTEAWYSCITKYAGGEYASAQAMLDEYLDICETQIQNP